MHTILILRKERIQSQIKDIFFRMTRSTAQIHGASDTWIDNGQYVNKKKKHVNTVARYREHPNYHSLLPVDLGLT